MMAIKGAGNQGCFMKCNKAASLQEVAAAGTANAAAPCLLSTKPQSYGS